MPFRSDTYFVFGIRTIFLVTALVAIFMCGVDLAMGHYGTGIIFWTDILSAVISSICIILFLFNRSKIKSYFGIISLVVFLNIAIEFYIKRLDNNILGIFLRDSIYIGLLITLGSFMISRYFSIILTALYVLILVLISLSTKNSFLLENFLRILVVFIAYAFVIYYFVGSLEKVMDDLHRSNEIVKAKSEEIQHQNVELFQQQEEIVAHRDILEQQKALIEKKNKDTFDNMVFAKSIQQTILPKEKDYKDYLPDSFILLFPKDAISGDFYWIQEKKGKIYIAAIDCTGHGASGALVSMIMYLTMNRVLIQLEDPTPSSILNKLDSILIAEFNKDNIDFNARIGMDIALVSIDIENMKIQYAGAINPLYMVRDGHLIQYKASRHLLGIDTTEIFNYFENFYIDIQPGDIIYLFSDGLPDQFGGIDGKKFGYKRFREFLEQISAEEMETQRNLITRFVEDWKGHHEQVDDILLIGIRF